jgi:hypothetical protein
MRRGLLIVVSAGLLSGVWASPAWAQGTPKLQLDPPNWNFGEVWFGTPLSQDVTLTNVGDAPLKIVNVRKTCGCTAHALQTNELAPGASTTMKVGYDSHKGAVNVTQTITIETNEPQPQTRFVISGVVKPLFEFTADGRTVPTPALNIGQIARGDEVTKSLTIRNVYGPDVKLRLAQPNVPNYKVELKEVKPGQVYELTATTVPPLPTTSVARLVELQTDLDFLKALPVRINGYVVAAVRVTPPVLNVSTNSVFPSVRNVNVLYRTVEPIQIVKVEVDDPRVTWELAPAPENAPAGPNAYHQIRVNVPPGKEIPATGVTMTIETDSVDPAFRKLIVPIRQFQPATRTGAAAPTPAETVPASVFVRPPPMEHTGPSPADQPPSKP